MSPILLRTTLFGLPDTTRTLAVEAGCDLSDLHTALQIAWSWQDYHLHNWTSRPYWEHRSDEDEMLPVYESVSQLCNDLGEGTMADNPVPDIWQTVGAAWPQPGAVLWYQYDYGDSWALRVERLPDQSLDMGRARIVLVDAAQHAPFEDCGGVPGWQNFLETVAGPPSPERDSLLDWKLIFEDGPFDPAHVPVEIIQTNLRLSFPAPDPGAQDDPDRLPWRPRAELDAALAALPRTAPADPGGEDWAALARPWSVLLDLVGSGLALTQTGRFTGKTIAALADALGWESPEWARWTEDNWPRATALRESARGIGLVRLVHKRLLPTQKAAKLVAEPRRLVEAALAKATAEPSQDREYWSGTFAYVCALGAGLPFDLVNHHVTKALHDLGWQMTDGTPLERWAVASSYRAADSTFTLLGAWPSKYGGTGLPAPIGVSLARRAYAAIIAPAVEFTKAERERFRQFSSERGFPEGQPAPEEDLP